MPESSPTPILYVKTGCPWCAQAQTHFRKIGLQAQVKDVLVDGQARARMQTISGQSLTPTFEYGDFIVADFSVAEFEAALEQHPEVRKALGLKV